MDEYNLIREFKKGDEKAFETVFRMYYKRLIVFALKLIDNKTDAEDIVLPAFQGLFSKCGGFDAINAIQTYLFISVRNKCLNHIKWKKRTIEKEMEFAELVQDDSYVIHEYSIKDELLFTIDRLIEELPGECKRIFKMLYFDQIQPAEIAKQLNIATQTVYAQKNRALNYLKSKLLNTP